MPVVGSQHDPAMTSLTPPPLRGRDPVVTVNLVTTFAAEEVITPSPTSGRGPEVSRTRIVPANSTVLALWWAAENSPTLSHHNKNV
jgi:hypothetical protein